MKLKDEFVKAFYEIVEFCKPENIKTFVANDSWFIYILLHIGSLFLAMFCAMAAIVAGVEKMPIACSVWCIVAVISFICCKMFLNMANDAW